jgi:hypothetical protein
MLLWYTGVSIVLVLVVFQSVGIDYRLIAAGSLLPLLVDLPLRRLAYGHSLIVTVALLVVVMVATIRRPRLLRRRLLCLPIGAFCGLVLSGAWADTDVFWWPFTGTTIPETDLFPEIGVVVLEELAGLAAWAWVVVRFRLTDPEPRAEFLRTGRLQEPATS